MTDSNHNGENASEELGRYAYLAIEISYGNMAEVKCTMSRVNDQQ